MNISLKPEKRLWIMCFFSALLMFWWMILLLNTDSFYSVYILCGMLGMGAMTVACRNPLNMSRREVIVISLSSAVFSGAVILANYQLFAPFKNNLLDLAAAFAGGFAVAWNILGYLCCQMPFKQIRQRESNIKKQTAVFFLCFAVIVTINLVYLFFAVYPGSLTPDSLFQIGEILNGYTSNHHPFWHTIVISVFYNVGLAIFGNVNAAVATYSVASVLFVAACFSHAITTLYRAGVSKKVLAICMLVYALAPYNIAYSVTMWKDVAFSAMVLLLVTALFRIFKNMGHLIPNLLCLLVSGVAISVWRSNGWLAFLAFSFLFVLYLLISKKKCGKIILIIGITVLTAWFMRSPMLSMLQIKQPDLVESLSVPVQQVARVISEERELTEEERSLLSRVVDIEEIPELYKPYISDPIKHEIRTKGQEYLIANKDAYFKLWIRLGLKYPGDYVRAWIEQTKGYYNGGYSYWIYSCGVDENSYSITNEVEPNGIQALYMGYLDFFSTARVMEPVRSIGLHIWALCALLVVCFAKKKPEMILCVPVIMIIATLLVATPVFSEFRYAYSVFTTLPFLTVVCLNSFTEKEEAV